MFYHSSGRTPNFSIHQSLCLKCIKERRSGQHTETCLYCCAVGVCFCIWRSRSIVITKACLAQTVLLLRVHFPKFLSCSVGWMQLDWYEGDKMMCFMLGSTVHLPAWILGLDEDWCLILYVLPFQCKVGVNIVMLCCYILEKC